MTALVFLFVVAVIFGMVLAVEVREPGAEIPHRPLGLIAWLTGGNWPAKIGGGLLVVGIGALLRYALINFDVPPTVKLSTGVVAAGLLGLAATLTRMGSARRAVSLALGGAAFGVAYMTAYSAFALFHYMASATGVGLLALTAIGAGVYAITRSALSLALLAMVGAFLAPAFAVSDPGAAVVYGYYCAASLLTLVMVAARGWRPLIHLSFVFTLIGGVFFAWTAQYYNAEHAAVMLPALLALVAIHVVMPQVERFDTRGRWTERLDLVYALALPLVAAISAWIIAPSRASLSNEVIGLAFIWSAVAIYLWMMKREGLALHAVIALLLLGTAVAVRYRDLPWELLALAFAVGALWFAARLSSSERLINALAGLVPLLGFLQVVSSLSPVPGSPVFVNGRFIERLVGAALLMLAGQICRRVRQSLDTLLWSVGIGWAVIAIGAELVRWDLVSLALVAHWVFIVAAIALAITLSRSAATANLLILVPLGTVVTASWAALNAPQSLSWVSLAIAPPALLWLAVRREGVEGSTRAGRLLSAIMAPLVAAIWATNAGHLAGINAPQFAPTIAAVAILLVLLVGYWLPARSEDWLESAAEIGAFAFAATLLLTTVFAISRSPWAIALELLALSGMLMTVYIGRDWAAPSRWLGPGAALGAGLLLQANLLRWLGPSGELNIADITRMRFPTAASLLWAVMGGALTVWGRRKLSRPLWVAGAVLLVAAAVKLVLVDFGSLGQLANILAVIAAGIVFMLVGWLAPMPPAAVPIKAPNSSSPAAARAAQAPRPVASHTEPAADQDSSRKTAWIIAILAGVVLPLAQCSYSTFDSVRRSLGFSHATPPQWVPPAPASRPAVSPPAMEPATVTEAQEVTIAPEQEANIAPPIVETECSQWAARLPENYVVYAAGAYKGHELDFTVDDSNHRASSFNVSVHVPDRNVVLMLGAYEPAIWNVKRSTATRIVGVWVSGYYSPQITGLESDVPLLRSSYAQSGDCPHFYLSGSDFARVAQAVQGTLKRGIEKVIMASDGRVAIGHTEMTPYYVQGEVKPLDSYRDRSLPLAGDRGIEELLREGKMRQATTTDLEQLKAAAVSERTVNSMTTLTGNGQLFRAYVVLKPLNVPADLYGAHAVTFIVPRGVERPQGDLGHSHVLDMNR